jgi:hypothetical protein
VDHHRPSRCFGNQESSRGLRIQAAQVWLEPGPVSEGQPGSKLELAHIRLAAACDSTVHAGDETRGAGLAINTARVRGGPQTQRNVVEDIESLELKLAFHPFRDTKVLEQRSIREVVRGTAEAVPANVANGAKGGSGKRTGDGAEGGERRYRREVPAAMCC